MGTSDEWVRFRPLAFSTYSVAGTQTIGEGFANGVAWSRDIAGVVRSETYPAAREQHFTDAFIAGYGYCGTTGLNFRSTLSPPARSNGRTFTVIQVQPSGGLPFALWIDRRTHLPVRTVEPYYYDVVETFDAYRRVGPVLVPFAKSGSGRVMEASYIATNSSGPSLPRWNPSDAFIAHGNSTVVPFKFYRNAIFVPVRFGSGKTYDFLFDTGGRDIVSSKIARELGLTITGAATLAGASGKNASAAYATIPVMHIGEATLRNQRVLVYDGLGDGMLGYEIPARFKTTIDFRQRTMTLSESSTRLSRALPFSFYDGTIPVIKASVEGTPGWFQVDTGSGRELSLTSPFVEENPRLERETLGALRRSSVPGGDTLAMLGVGPNLSLGACTIEHPVTYYAKDQQGVFADRGLAGNIGIGILQQFTLTLDYAREQIGLEPNDAYEAMQNDMSGVSLVDEPSGLYVDYVAPGPAYSAGLREGDTITSIGGVDAATLDAVAALRMLNQVTRPVIITAKDTSGADRTLLYSLRRGRN